MRIIILIFLSVLLFSLGCINAPVSKESTDKPVNENPSTEVAGTTGKNSADETASGSSSAVNNSMERCLNSSRRSETSFKRELIWACYEREAVRQSNADVCDGLLTVEADASLTRREAHDGYEYCIRSVATRTKNLNACNKLGDGIVEVATRYFVNRTVWRYGCIDAVANALNDPAICDLILDTNMQKTCRKYASE